MIPVGTTIAGYRIRGLVGTGAMGVIYAVDDPQLPRLDALKVLSAELSHDAGFRARFIREADVAAGLEHPNIVSIYDRGETADHQLWIAMQFVGGTDAEAASRSGGMTPRRAVHIIGAVADALDYAHAHRVLHRDVKPANFLLSGPIGDDERVLLGDFGIARAIDDAGLTGTNSVMATMAYAAPEVLSGRTGDYRSDLYSLGCALFELLTGSPPYAEAPSDAAQATAHLRQPPPRPSATVPSLGTGFDEIIATAMAKDPAQRYQSARALADAARRALPRSTPDNGPGVGPVGLHGADTMPAALAAAPTATRGRGRGRLIGIAVATVAVLVAAGAAFTVGRRTADSGSATTSTTATSAQSIPLITGDRLPSLLLNADRVGAIVGFPVEASPDVLREFDNGRNFNDCYPALFPFQTKTYQSSAAVDQYAVLMRKAGTTGPDVVFQAVVSFPSRESATEFIRREATLRSPCAFKQVEVQAPSAGKPSNIWQIDHVDFTDGLLSLTGRTDGNTRLSQHAMTAVNNIVIDVVAQISDRPDAAVAIARGIGDQISH